MVKSLATGILLASQSAYTSSIVVQFACSLLLASVLLSLGMRTLKRRRGKEEKERIDGIKERKET